MPHLASVSDTPPPSMRHEERNGGEKDMADDRRPLVSLIVPAFNEAGVLENNLTVLCRYMRLLENDYQWEIILVNDGSRDNTGVLAEAFSKSEPRITVVHHPTNFGLGQALKTGFGRSSGDYVVVLDIDLSYSPEHIQRLLAKIRETRAKIVIASPYTDGGEISNVPWLRRTMSVWANRFLALTAPGQLSTLTGMVRAYDGPFIRAMNLRAMGMDVNPEAIYKTMLLRGRIEEIPAHLDWQLQNAVGKKRSSSMRMFRQIISTLLSGFIFRPFMFFILPGLALFAFATYVNVWMLIHFFHQYRVLTEHSWFLDRASAAVGVAYNQFPHTFIVGLASLMVSIQLISLGILALQSKGYFEEVFHLASATYRATLRTRKENP